MLLAGRGDKIYIKSFGNQKLVPGLVAQGELRHPPDLANIIKKMIKGSTGRKVRSDRAVVNLPETRTYIKVLELPPTGLEAIHGLLQQEIENHFPIAADEAYLKWELIGDSGREKMKVLVGVAPQKVVENYLALLNLAGLQAISLEIEALAIARALLRPGQKSAGAKMILDLGANRSSLIVYDHGTVQFSISLPVSGNQITQEISQTLKMDTAQAEEIKVMCGLDPKRCQGALRQVITLILNDLVARSRDALEYYYDNFSDANAVDQVILCGGGAKLIGLTDHLTKLLKMPVNLGNPFVNFNLKQKWQLNRFPPTEALNYVTAIGLGLKGLNF